MRNDLQQCERQLEEVTIALDAKAQALTVAQSRLQAAADEAQTLQVRSLAATPLFFSFVCSGCPSVRGCGVNSAQARRR